MKKLFFITSLCFSCGAFAQDSTAVDYGMRIYDARIGHSISVDPKASPQNNPYQFEQENTATDSTRIIQPADKPKQTHNTT